VVPPVVVVVVVVELGFVVDFSSQAKNTIVDNAMIDNAIFFILIFSAAIMLDYS
jgi:hypothetical protein